MLKALFEALQPLLMPLGIPVFLADCIPEGVGLPYLAADIEAPAAPGLPGKVTLTLWCAGASANAERLRLGDELTALLPDRGLCLSLPEHAVTLRPTGSVTCTRVRGALALKRTFTLGCIPLTAPVACTLDGVSLADTADALHMLDVHEDAPRMHTSALPRIGGGTRTLLHQRESLSVRITMALTSPDSVRREEALRAASAWADAGGMLRLSTRPGQRLRIDRAAMSAVSAEDWTESLCLTLTACDAPWWESAEPVRVTIADEGVLHAPGDTGNAPVSAVITNTGEAALTRVSVGCGGTQMTFEGLSVPAGAALSLHAADGLLIAQVGEDSVLDRRTSISDDLLLADCGRVNLLSVSADQPVSAEFSMRGRWL